MKLNKIIEIKKIISLNLAKEYANLFEKTFWEE